MIQVVRFTLWKVTVVCPAVPAPVMWRIAQVCTMVVVLAVANRVVVHMAASQFRMH